MQNYEEDWGAPFLSGTIDVTGVPIESSRIFLDTLALDRICRLVLEPLTSWLCVTDPNGSDMSIELDTKLLISPWQEESILKSELFNVSIEHCQLFYTCTIFIVELVPHDLHKKERVTVFNPINLGKVCYTVTTYHYNVITSPSRRKF